MIFYRSVVLQKLALIYESGMKAQACSVKISNIPSLLNGISARITKKSALSDAFHFQICIRGRAAA